MELKILKGEAEFVFNFKEIADNFYGKILKNFLKEDKRMVNLVEERTAKELKGKLFINGKSIEKFHRLTYKVNEEEQEFHLEIGRDRFKINKKQKEKFLNRIHILIAKCNIELNEELKNSKSEKFTDMLIKDLSNVIINCTKFLIDVNRLNPTQDSFKNAKILLLKDFEDLENYYKKNSAECVKCGSYTRSNKKVVFCSFCTDKYISRRNKIEERK